jgi:hypothetical protein
MHPIEHLRYIARARGADPRDLVRETAYALGALGCGPAELMVACRRILDRHKDCAPLWWLCSQVLCDPDLIANSWSFAEIAEQVEDDTTDQMLAEALAPSAKVLTLAGGPTVAAGLGRRGDLEVLVVDSRHQGSAMIQYFERRDVPCEPVQPEAMAAALAEVDLVVLEADAISPQRAITRIGGQALVTLAHAAAVPVWMVAPTGVGLADLVLSAIDAELSEMSGARWGLDHELVDLTGITKVLAGGQIAPFAPELLKRSHMP